MTDQHGGYGLPTPGDRLNALRTPPTPPSVSTENKKNRPDALIISGVCLVVLILGLIFFRTHKSSIGATVKQQLSEQITEKIQKETGMSVLLDGDVLFGVAVKPGNYPAEMKVGDIVRAVLTPSISGTGTAKEIDGRMTVVSIDASTDVGGDTIVTLSGPEAVTTEIAMSGPIHLTIVEVGSK